MNIKLSLLVNRVDGDSNRLRESLHTKIAKRKKEIHPEHSARFDHVVWSKAVIMIHESPFLMLLLAYAYVFFYLL
jgi:hypothetical protein